MTNINVQQLAYDLNDKGHQAGDHLLKQAYHEAANMAKSPKYVIEESLSDLDSVLSVIQNEEQARKVIGALKFTDIMALRKAALDRGQALTAKHAELNGVVSLIGNMLSGGDS